MSTILTSGQKRSFVADLREASSVLLQALIEGSLLFMVCLAPWAYGCVHTGFEFLFNFGVFLLTLLWGARIVVEGSFTWHKCPVSLALAGLFLLGIWQTAPLNRAFLAQISPTTAQWYDELLPMADEMVVADETRLRSVREYATISINAHVTRRALRGFLAVSLVFLVVRHNLQSPRAFRRFASVVLANGACLALFAIVQYLSSPRNLLYWSVPSVSTHVFGPFVYRNHYACYMNLCIGMGLGVLWSRRNSAASGALQVADPHGFGITLGPARRRLRIAISTVAAPLTAFFRLLHDPASLWTCVALALMASSVVFTLSRGGFMALVGGFVGCFLAQIASSTHFVRFGTLLLIVGMMVGILGWFGIDRFETRYATLWSGNALEQSRLPLWRAATNIIRDFPVWGTGFGTYQFVDPPYRRSAEVADLTIDHLHNDHLEMLVEGGVIGLLFTWVVLGLVYFFGLRAFRSNGPVSGLALGAIFSVTTLVLHGFGDFLICVPAIALLATVASAHLCNSGMRSNPANANFDPAAPGKRSVHGITAIFASVVFVALGYLVMNEGKTAHAAESLRQAIYDGDPKGSKTTLSELGRRKELLEGAVQLTPHDADLRRELADTDADLYRQHGESMRACAVAAKIATVVLLSAQGATCRWAPSVAFLPFVSVSASHVRGIATAEERKLARQFLVPALENYLQARNDAPLLPGTHLGLALHANRLARGDAAQRYLDRVQRLLPADPAFWYFCGNQELRMGLPDRAWKSWRHSLELSDRYLVAIADRGRKLLGTEGLIDLILPDRPTALADAAWKLYPRPNQAKEREPFLRKALRLLNDQPGQLTIDDLQTKASICQALRRFDDAVQLYRELLRKHPLQITYRMELAQALFEDGRLEESQAELAMILSQQPQHARAHELWTRIIKDLVRRK